MLGIGIIGFIGFWVLTIAGLRKLKKGKNSLESVILTLYIFSLVLFSIGLSSHSNPYYKAIDPVDLECYSPFSDKNGISLLFYVIAFKISLLLVWTKRKTLPPLTLSISLIFIAIGILISAAILLQISVHNTESLDAYNSGEEQILFIFAPIFSIIIGVYLIYQVTFQAIDETSQRVYSNKILNFLNTFLANKCRNPLWIMLLMLPVFLLITILLILFGQDTNSMVKVFTDTTTWKFSQQIHPPILDHKGHYLCTVAATGEPKIVKPLRLGTRNGKQIIVNRQLLIANAFEEWIQDIAPQIHCVIRKNYDKYGYNLSRKINTPFLSNVTYLIMKPVEWIFLICLYLFCYEPEKKINRQYAV
jgi:hypothetical protein